jgi:hypothetical protein
LAQNRARTIQTGNPEILPTITTNLPDSLKDVRLSVEVDENYIKAVATKQL